MHVLPTADAAEGSKVLDEVLRDASAGRVPTDWTAEQLRSLWTTLESGGWDRLGADERDGGFGLGLRDLVEIGRVLGRYLIPTPISTTLALRAPGLEGTSSGPLGVALPRRTRPSTARALYGGFPDVQMFNAGHPAGTAASERFAPSLLVVGGPAGGVRPLGRRACHRLSVLWAAESVGAAQTLLLRSVEYAKVRRQFGQPIGQFQAVKHLLADGQLAYQEALTATVHAANCEEPPPATLRLVFDRCVAVSETASQVHGGIGMTWELGQHYYARHIIALRDLIEDLLAQKGR